MAMTNEMFFVLWGLFIIVIAMVDGLYFYVRDHRHYDNVEAA